MSGSKAKEQRRQRRQFLADQRAAVLDEHARFFRIWLSDGGQLQPHSHPVGTRFENRLRLWVRNGLIRRCAHLDLRNAPARSFWLVRRPDLIRCMPCLRDVFDGEAAGRQKRCDHCARTGLPLAGHVVLVDTTMVLSDICEDCRALGATS